MAVERHVKIGREYRNQQQYDSPTGKASERGNKEHQPQNDFRRATQHDQRFMPGNVGRHDLQVRFLVCEMIQPIDNIEEGHCVKQNCLQIAQGASSLKAAKLITLSNFDALCRQGWRANRSLFQPSGRAATPPIPNPQVSHFPRAIP